jgi:hypothetical protein
MAQGNTHSTNCGIALEKIIVNSTGIRKKGNLMRRKSVPGFSLRTTLN